MVQENISGTLATTNDQTIFNEKDDYRPRRLTPVEYERLQGFPDDWTKVPYRGKPSEQCPDGPRYKALGNAVKAAADAVTISKDLYKNGLKDFNNVLDAQRSRLQLEEELVISRGRITIDLIDLYKALGGGLSVIDDEEDEPETP